jgi:hypothetical protein
MIIIIIIVMIVIIITGDPDHRTDENSISNAKMELSVFLS